MRRCFDERIVKGHHFFNTGVSFSNMFAKTSSQSIFLTYPPLPRTRRVRSEFPIWPFVTKFEKKLAFMVIACLEEMQLSVKPFPFFFFCELWSIVSNFVQKVYF